MIKDKKAFSWMSTLRDLSLILGIVSGLIGFGPEILESLSKLIDAKRQYTLYSNYVDYGQKLFDNGSYSDSTESFKEAINLQPHSIVAQVWFKKARLMSALSELSSIKKEDISRLSFEVEFVIQSNPPDVHLYYFIQGNIKYYLKDFKGAQESYEKALDNKPNYGQALANLGAILNELKEHDKAANRLRAALKSGYIKPEVYNNLTLALYSVGKNQEAVSIANEGLKYFPRAANIYNELAIALFRLGRKEESISALKISYVMTPKADTDMILQRSINIAYPLADTGQIDEALSYLQSAKDVSPENPQIYLALAHCYNVTKNDIKTVEAYEKIGSLGAYPNPEDLVKWAEALERLKRPEEAHRILQIAINEVIGTRQEKQVMENLRALSTKLGDQEFLHQLDEIYRSKRIGPTRETDLDR